MNFNPSDLTGVLPALILAAGALVLLISEVFLRAVRPEALGRAGGQPVTPAQRAEAGLPKGSQGYSEPAPAADRRYQAWLSAVFAGLAFWAAVSQLGDPATPLFSGGAVSDAFGRVVSAVVSWQFRNMLAERYTQVPGYFMPHQTQFYGVRWEFWD